jgi:hypothetical protein
MISEALPCPFCGSAPVWKTMRGSFSTGSGMESPKRALGCTAPLCTINPQTRWRDMKTYYPYNKGYVFVDRDWGAIADWNRRPA